MPDLAALNLITLGPATLEQKLYAAVTAGFPAVGLLWEEMQQAGEPGLQELRLSELAVAELMGLSGWMDHDRTAREVALVEAEKAFELAARVECSVVIAWPSSEPVDLVAAADWFRDLCRPAEPLRVRVGLEFLGACEYVKDLTRAWEIVDAADAPNGGLVIDTFHFHRGGSTFQMFDPVPAEKIFLLQISDCADLPRHELEDRHRVYPGSGVAALEPLLAAVHAKGYSGYYSLELHNEAYWQEDPLIVAREGLRAMRRLDIA